MSQKDDKPQPIEELAQEDMNIQIGNNGEQVTIDFGKPVSFIGISKDAAKQIAMALIANAR